MPTDIQVIAGLEPIRRRPEMYVGEGPPAVQLTRLVELLCESALDPENANQARSLELRYIAHENAIVVIDDGRGLPVDPVSYPAGEVAHPRLELALLTLFAGGARDPTMKSFHEKWGHLAGGIGPVCAALSEYLVVTTTWEERSYRLVLARGAILSLLRSIERGPQGTSVYLRPDPMIFGDAKFDERALRLLSNRLSAKYPDARIEFYVESLR